MNKFGGGDGWSDRDLQAAQTDGPSVSSDWPDGHAAMGILRYWVTYDYLMGNYE